MFKNYLKIAIRNLSKQKLFSLINIFGLTIGITCSLLILLWVKYELNYDTFHKNLEKICRTVSDSEGYHVPVTAGPMAAYLEKNIPQVAVATRFKPTGASLTYDNRTVNLGGLNIEPSFFDIFTFPIIKGANKNTMDDVSSIILTESSASKLFGDEDPIGKVIKMNNKYDFTVNAIVKDVPKNSSPPLQFQFLAPFKNYYAWRDPDSWTANSDYQTWIKLSSPELLDAANKSMKDIIRENYPEETQTYFFQPLSEIHLRPNTDRWDGPHGDINYVIIFMLLVIVIISIACINFTNLTIAKSFVRAKEIGIRKVVGARKDQLLGQFFTETLIINILALIAAIILTKLALPWFSNITRQVYSFSLVDPSTIIAAFIIFFLVTIASGIYPALYLSSFPIIKILQTRSLSNHRNKHLSFRKILVVTQFVLSVIVIIATIVINQQLKYIHNKKLGFDKENLLYISVPWNYPDKTYNSLKNDLMSDPNILSVGGSNQIPTDRDFVTTGYFIDKGVERQQSFTVFRVDEDFIDTYKIQLIQGRNFNREITSDYEHSFIMNETALKTLNLEDPFNTEMKIWKLTGHLIGVVKDFHFESMKEEVKPLVFMLSKQCGWLNIRLTPHDINSKVKMIEKTFHNHYPNAPFRLRFLDNMIDNLYASELRMLKIFEYFSMLAIIITSLGLYGVISFVTNERVKEVGIRKVLGASEISIIKTVAGEFMLLITVANIIAWPVAFFFMREWLTSFSYRINLSVVPFIMTTLLSFTIAILTISWKIFKTARSNPVEALKYE